MVTEGLMSLMDIVARNTLHYLNPNVYLVSGYAYIISFDMIEKLFEALQYMISSSIFPSAMGIIFPVFMHISALERHLRLKSIMQMHGLKEVHYWLANIANNYLLYLIVYFSFYFVGRYVLDLTVFSSTSPLLMVNFNDVACTEHVVGTESNWNGNCLTAVCRFSKDNQHSWLHSFIDCTIHVHLHVHTDVQQSF